jgi:hypothetical protein
MMKLLKLSIASFLLVLKTQVVLADPLCWLRSTSPLDDVLEGPIQLDRDWKVYKLVKPFRVSPHVYSIELLLNDTKYDLFDIGESGKNAKAWIGLVPRDIKNHKNYFFEVKARNSKLGWINLMPTSAGTSIFNGKSFTSVGYGSNPEKLQGFYPADSVVEEIHLRASGDVTVEHIRWIAKGYWQWPCRKWAEVPASEFIHPESKTMP